MPERIDERSAGIAGRQIAPIQQQIPVRAKGTFPPANHLAVIVDRLGIQPRVAELQAAGGSMRQQMQGIQVLIPAENVPDLLDPIAVGVEDDHF